MGMYLLQLAQFFGHLLCALFALFLHRSVTSVCACATTASVRPPLSPSRSGVGLTSTLLLLDGLRLHLLVPSFLPDLIQQLPPMFSDSEHRAVKVIVIRMSLPFVLQALSLLLLALQQIVLD